MADEAEAASPMLAGAGSVHECRTSEDPQQLCFKPEASHQSLQIDCRANSSQPDIYKAFHIDSHCSSGDQPDAGLPPQDGTSMQSRLDAHQDPTSSHESSRPSECLSPSPVQPHEKSCSQCGATKTPMWRNDTNGNKTLCNACGVRLQRQLNKQKQQSQAAADNPTSLIAGKLPRCRTSPAKLSRQDLTRSSSQDTLRQLESASQKAIGRSLTLVHNSNGQPTLTIAGGPSKRKGLEGAFAFSNPKLDERKRLCNSKPDSTDTATDGLLDMALPTDLLIPNGRAPNCLVRLELASMGSQGPAGGRLRVFTAAGKLAASSTLPGNQETLQYSMEHQAWIWTASSQWSLLFTDKDTCTQFEELLKTWRRSRQMEVSSGWGALDTGMHVPNPANTKLGTSNKAGAGRLGQRVEADDQKFLDHINAKIMKEANGSFDASNPKALNALLSENTFLHLISTFEYFLQRSNGFGEASACQLSVNLDWTPNRAVILAVHRYWVGKLYRHKRWADFNKATSTSGGHHAAAIPRSFSASPPLGSGRSDISAMTLEDFALSHGGVSEETSANVPSQSAFAPKAADVAGGGILDFPTSTGASMQQGLDGDFNVGLGMLPQTWLPNASFSPTLGGPFEGLPQVHAAEEWDPLDPSNLARIADPNQNIPFETQKSANMPGLQEACSLSAMGSAIGSSSSGMPPMRSLGFGQQHGSGPMDMAGKPPTGALMNSPALMPQGDAGSAVLPSNSQAQVLEPAITGRGSGVDLTSLRSQLYSGSFSTIEDRPPLGLEHPRSSANVPYSATDGNQAPASNEFLK